MHSYRFEKSEYGQITLVRFDILDIIHIILSTIE
jgi:hypothetical protein